jgi:hypothetical protein
MFRRRATLTPFGRLILSQRHGRERVQLISDAANRANAKTSGSWLVSHRVTIAPDTERPTITAFT